MSGSNLESSRRRRHVGDPWNQQSQQKPIRFEFKITLATSITFKVALKPIRLGVSNAR